TGGDGGGGDTARPEGPGSGLCAHQSHSSSGGASPQPRARWCAALRPPPRALNRSPLTRSGLLPARNSVFLPARVHCDSCEVPRGIAVAVRRSRERDMAHDAVETKRRATYDDLLLVPDTMVAEIVDGDLVVTPRPATPHAFAAAEIAADLLPAFHGIEARSGPGGWWILPEPELHF